MTLKMLRYESLVVADYDFVRRTCEFNAAGENSSFISACNVQTVSLYHCQLV